MGICNSVNIQAKDEILDFGVEIDSNSSDNSSYPGSYVGSDPSYHRPLFANNRHNLYAGYYESKGRNSASRKEYNEDQAIAVEQLLLTSESWLDLQLNISLYGIFDGHAGHRASLFVAEHYPPLLQNLIQNLSREEVIDSEIIKDIMAKSFSDMDQKISDVSKDNPNVSGGCTALVSLFIDCFQLSAYSDDASGGSRVAKPTLLSSNLYVANSGDCRAVVSICDKPYRVSFDHTPHSDLPRLISVALKNHETLGFGWFVPREWVDDICLRFNAIAKEEKRNNQISSPVNQANIARYSEHFLKKDPFNSLNLEDKELSHLFPVNKCEEGNLCHMRKLSRNIELSDELRELEAISGSLKKRRRSLKDFEVKLVDYIQPLSCDELIEEAQKCDLVMNATSGLSSKRTPFIIGTSKHAKILGKIGTSRGFGDFELQAFDREPGGICREILCKPFLSCHPSVSHINLLSAAKGGLITTDDFLVMGCDGIWDVTSDEKAITTVISSFNILRERPHPFDFAAENILKLAQQKSGDDLTVFVCPLLHHLL